MHLLQPNSDRRQLLRWWYRLVPLLILVLGLLVTRAFIVGVRAEPAAAPGAGSTELLVVGDDTSDDFYRGTFYRTGVSRREPPEGDGNGELRLLAVGLAGDWSFEADPAGLPEVKGHTVETYVDANGVEHVYVIGGQQRQDSSETLEIQSKIYHTTIDDDGPADVPTPLENWELLSEELHLPQGRSDHESAIVGDYLYVIGGQTSSSIPVTNTVYVAPINPVNGMLEGFAETTPLTLPTPYDCNEDGTDETDAVRAQMAVSVVTDTIYVIGGTSGVGGGTKCIFYATPDSDGTISSWNRTTVDYPVPVFGNTAVSYGGRLYGVGGGDAEDDVYYVQPDADGDITDAWSQGTPAQNAYHVSALTVYNGQLLLIGGAINNRTEPVNEVSAILINRDYSLDQWVSSEPLQQNRILHDAVISSRGWIYVIGGAQTQGTSAINDIDYGTLVGEARQYAPTGDYTSRAFDLDATRQLSELRWTTFFTQATGFTATMEYRTANSQLNLSSAPWQGPYLADEVAGVHTNTQSISDTGRFVQYRLSLGTVITTRTPVVQRVEVEYEVPAPDVTVSKSTETVLAGPGDLLTYTIQAENIRDLSAPAQDVRITETIPSFTQYVTSSLPFSLVGTTPDGSKQYATTLTETLEANMTDTLSFVIQITDTAAALPDDPVLTNTVGIGASNEDPSALGNNEDTLTTDLALVVLDLEKQNTPSGVVEPGDEIEYTLTYSNVSDFDANDVVIRDQVPADTTFVSESSPGAGFVKNGEDLEWTVGSLPAHSSGEVSFIVEVNTANLSSDRVENAAEIESRYTQPLESNTVENALDIKPALTATKAVWPGAIEAGDLLTYTIYYTNTGNVLLEDVVFTDSVPADTAYVSGSVSAPGMYDGATDRLTWDIGAVDVGVSGSVEFQVRVDKPLPAGTTEIQNTAHAQTRAVAPFTTNQATAEVTSKPVLKLSKVATPRYDIFPGDLVTFTLSYTNVGDIGASGIVITDRIPTGTSVEESGGATESNGVLTWQPSGELEGLGGSGSVTFVVSVDSLGDGGIANDEYAITATDQGVTTNGDPVYVPAGPDLAALRIVANQTVFRTEDSDSLVISVDVTNKGASFDDPDDDEDADGVWTDLYVRDSPTPPSSPDELSDPDVDTYWYVSDSSISNGAVVRLKSRDDDNNLGSSYPSSQLSAGTYYAYAQINTDDGSDIFPVDEWPRTNNIVGPLVFTVTESADLAGPPPTVNSVTPNPAPADDGLELTISGTNFQPGASVWLRRSGDSRAGYSIQVSGTNSITAKFNMRGQLLGTWDVEVKNPDGGTGVLADGLTLTEQSDDDDDDDDDNGGGGNEETCPPNCGAFLPLIIK